MKRHRHLWEQIVTFENLAGAARDALRGKGGRRVGAAFFGEWETEVVRLERELRERTYRPGTYRYFRILDPKERVVAAAPFRDRVVHHALVRVIADEGALWLMDLILASHVGRVELRWPPGGELFEALPCPRGLPIGNLTSQFFANVYLDGFDHFVKQESVDQRSGWHRPCRARRRAERWRPDRR